MRRTPQQSRFLGLWTASWLFVFLLALLLWVGDLRVQWPALLVPVAWALLALARGRRRRPVRRPPEDEEFWPPEEDPWPPEDDEPPVPRRPPATRELPWLPEVPRDRREE
jgi:hypothetical protein